MLDDLLGAVSWVLARDPYFFPMVSGTPFVRIKTRPGTYGCPALTMFATIDDDDNCTLQWVEFTVGETGSDELTEYDLDSFDG